MNYRYLTAALFVCVIALSVVASGGFSAMDLDRGSTIQIVGNDHAIVGVDACYVPNGSAQSSAEESVSEEHGATPVRIEVTNRLGQEITVTEITGDKPVVSNRNYQPTVRPGDSAQYVVPFNGAPSEATVLTSARGIGIEVTVDIHQEQCPPPSTSSSDSERGG